MSREKFLTAYQAFMAPKLPEIGKEWDKLPAGFRRLLCVQSGQPGLLDTPFAEFTALQMRKLMDANQQLEELCFKARRTLTRGYGAKG